MPNEPVSETDNRQRPHRIFTRYFKCLAKQPQPVWFSEGLWQWLIHYRNTVWETLHFFRYIWYTAFQKLILQGQYRGNQSPAKGNSRLLIRCEYQIYITQRTVANMNLLQPTSFMTDVKTFFYCFWFWALFSSDVRAPKHTKHTASPFLTKQGFTTNAVPYTCFLNVWEAR
jgi:hypothetical protein